MGRDEEDSFSNRAEHAVACITLEDVLIYAGSKRPLILPTDSKCLLMAIQKWIGAGINPTFKKSFNEVADRWADKGRHTETEARWTSLRQRPIFTRIASGVAHCSTMSKVVKTWAHLMAARLQLHEHDNLTAKFLKREDNCRLVLGDH